jgi:hypothetical protein
MKSIKYFDRKSMTRIHIFIEFMNNIVLQASHYMVFILVALSLLLRLGLVILAFFIVLFTCALRAGGEEMAFFFWDNFDSFAFASILFGSTFVTLE